MEPTKHKSLKLNFIMNIILTMSSFIFPLITFPYVSRILHPAGIGKVAFASSLITYFSMFAQLGIPTYGIRACAKVRDNKEELTRRVHEIFVINCIMTCFAYLIFFIVLFNMSKLQNDKALYIVVSLTIIFNSIGMEWLYKALENYTYITIRSLIFKFLALIAMFALIHSERDYIMYGAITIFAASASNIFNFFNIHKYIGLRPVGNYNLKRHIKAIIIFLAMSIATTIYTNLDTVMLGLMKTDNDVGYYNAAVKIKAVLVSLVTSLGAVLLPRTSYYVEHGLISEFYRITKKSLHFVILLATPLMVYFILFASQGIVLLSGPAFKSAVLPMQIIMPTLLFVGITNVIGIQTLIPLGMERFVLYSEIAGASINLIINFILIPKYSSVGTAIGTVVAELIVLVVQYLSLKEIISPILKSIHYTSITLGLVLAILASNWIKELNLNCFLTLLLSSICFLGVYCSVLIIAKEPLVIDILNQFNKQKYKFNKKFRKNIIEE
jgi:O-antigen/teichoic acid export membrane protein